MALSVLAIVGSVIGARLRLTLGIRLYPSFPFIPPGTVACIAIARSALPGSVAMTVPGVGTASLLRAAQASAL